MLLHWKYTLKCNPPHSIYVSFSAATISCSFENPYKCGYEEFSATSGFTWLRWEARTPTGYTGPNVDHTMDGEVGGKGLTQYSAVPY